MTTTQSSTPSIEDVMNTLTELIKSNGSLDVFEATYNKYNKTTPYNLFTISFDHGCTLLHACVAAGNKPVAQFLLENGADPNVKTEHGNTPLHGAAIYNKLDMARLLLQYGADINATNNPRYGQRTPFYTALNKNNLEVARLLIEHGAKPNARMLYNAIWKLNIDKIKFLLDYFTQEIIEKLLSQALTSERDIRGKLNGPNGKKAIINLVAEYLESKFNNNTYERLLYVFVKEQGIDCYALIEFVLDKTYEYEQLSQQVLNKALQISVNTRISGCRPGITKLLLNYGADANMRDENNNSLLHFIIHSSIKAGLCRAASLMKCLIDNGVDVNVLDPAGHTVLYYVVRCCEEYNSIERNRLIAYLLSVGAVGADVDNLDSDKFAYHGEYGDNDYLFEDNFE